MDCDGAISYSDLNQALQDLGYECDLQEAQDMVHCFDKDGDGSIDFAEFVQLMMYDTSDRTLYDQN